MTLKFSNDDYHKILEEAVNGRLHEVCGILGGWNGVVHSVWPIRNAAADTTTRYLVDPREFVEAYQQIERAGDDLIGVYHSHPMGQSVPSPADIAEATWPDAVYVIVGFTSNDPELRGWSIVRGKVTPIAIIVS